MLVAPAFAEELPLGTVQMPSSLVCGVYNPNLNELQETYGELPFLEGTGQVLSPDVAMAYGGNVRMYLNPDNGNYSIFIDVKDTMTCLIVTGEGMTPMGYSGQPL